MTTKLKGDGSLFLTEQAAAAADVAGDGQLWVENTTPNKLKFTDDAGTDQDILTTLDTQAVVQVVNVTDGAVATGTISIPNDNTIPQITEGNEFMTLAITPKSASNILLIQVVAYITNSGNGVIIHGALFQDSTADALAATSDWVATTGAAQPTIINHYMVAGTTSATTFKFRAGLSGGTTSFNGTGAGVRLMGGVMSSSITITEYQP